MPIKQPCVVCRPSRSSPLLSPHKQKVTGSSPEGDTKICSWWFKFRVKNFSLKCFRCWRVKRPHNKAIFYVMYIHFIYRCSSRRWMCVLARGRIKLHYKWLKSWLCHVRFMLWEAITGREHNGAIVSLNVLQLYSTVLDIVYFNV